MAKAKTEEIVSFEEKLKELDKRFSRKSVERIIIPTGSVALDKAYGGGYNTGRVYEYIAWEGAGKTSLSLHAIAEAQKLNLNVAYIDAEHALDEAYAKAIGVNWDKFKPSLFQPDFGEEGFEYAKELLKTGELRLLIIDSTSGMLPKKQMEDPAGSSNLGLHARLMGTEVPKLVQLADKNNCCVIFISQFREKIGVMFGSPETTQGGNALKFWASVRTELRRQLNKDGDDVIGINAKFKMIKNKLGVPYQTGAIPIIFGMGINKVGELIELGNEAEILKTWGKTITLLDNGAGGETKYTQEEFISLLNDNQEFFDCISKQIKEKINIKQEVE